MFETTEQIENVDALGTHAVPEANETNKKPLGERLVDEGFLSKEQLELALKEKSRNGGFLGEVLVRLNFISDEVLTNYLAAETQTKVINVKQMVIDDELLQLIPYEQALKYKVLPIGKQGDELTIAMSDAFDIVAIDALEKLTNLIVVVVSSSESEILEAIERHYSQGVTIDATISRLMKSGVTPTEEEGFDGESPMVRLVDQVIALGIKQGATDIHFEPEEKILRVRMRIDGIMRPEVLLPSDLRPALTARVKLISGMNVTEKRVPQDGRSRFHYGNRNVDLRVSTLPTSQGESIVIRILESADNRPQFENLGLAEDVNKQIKSVLKQPYGMVLVTGPTGSGKTTTLYAGLGEIDSVERSVFTLEDPVEYAMPQIRQTPIKADVGVTFASGLRSLLRQDPDVILVGEIRDQETAELAIRASLTGHLVLSTLHTNDAAGAIPRLIDMGIEPYLLASSLSVVIAQRLVRKVCEDCKEPITNSEQILNSLDVSDKIDKSATYYHGTGCVKCKGSGFKGRVAIYETLVLDEDFHDPIINKANSGQLTDLFRQKGGMTLLDDGILKAAQGLTSIDEVLRVTKT